MRKKRSKPLTRFTPTLGNELITFAGEPFIILPVFTKGVLELYCRRVLAREKKKQKFFCLSDRRQAHLVMIV